MTSVPSAPSERHPDSTALSERHASWLELFFDLIAVAGVAQLAHLLHGSPGRADLGLYCLLYLAFWTAWMCFTTYGNVAAEKVRTRTVLVGMFGLAVMAAAVPGVRTDHATAFALAYVIVRVLASRVWRRRGEVVADWPAAQVTAGVTPWFVSVWAEAPARYWLWAAGLAVDLALTFARSRSQVLARAQKDWEEHEGSRARYGGRARKREGRGSAGRGGSRTGDAGQDGARDGSGAGAGGEGPDRAGGGGRERGHDRASRPRPVAARFDPGHLDERLGLFTLIVLGEGIALGVEAASEAEWDRGLCTMAVGSFALLLSLWALAVRRSCGVPLLGFGVLAPRFALPLHCVSTGALAAVAASLGGAVEHAEGRLPHGMRWLLCGGIAVFLAVGLLAGVVSGRGTRWALAAGLPMAVAPLLLAVSATDWSPATLVWCLVLVARWPWFYERRTRRRSGTGAEDRPTGRREEPEGA
ncbi:low temperature requirement protein A [Streptomyces sp. NPDC101490]|uniref:low temperature requirement protein A n=1 Tax=Streptomyces sp. NPDC101490 TaxID=3366143 RepID=UPI0037F76360